MSQRFIISQLSQFRCLSTSAKNAEAISEFFSLPHQYVGKKKKKKTGEDSAETFAYCVGSEFGIPRHFDEGYDLVLTTCSTWIKLFTFNTLELVERKTTFLSLINLFWFLRVSFS